MSPSTKRLIFWITLLVVVLLIFYWVGNKTEVGRSAFLLSLVFILSFFFIVVPIVSYADRFRFIRTNFFAGTLIVVITLVVGMWLILRILNIQISLAEPLKGILFYSVVGVISYYGYAFVMKLLKRRG